VNCVLYGEQRLLRVRIGDSIDRTMSTPKLKVSGTCIPKPFYWLITCITTKQGGTVGIKRANTAITLTAGCLCIHLIPVGFSTRWDVRGEHALSFVSLASFYPLQNPRELSSCGL
jgi:hypothetical protein